MEHQKNRQPIKTEVKIGADAKYVHATYEEMVWAARMGTLPLMGRFGKVKQVRDLGTEDAPDLEVVVTLEDGSEITWRQSDEKAGKRGRLYIRVPCFLDAIGFGGRL